MTSNFIRLNYNLRSDTFRKTPYSNRKEENIIVESPKLFLNNYVNNFIILKGIFGSLKTETVNEVELKLCFRQNDFSPQFTSRYRRIMDCRAL